MKKTLIAMAVAASLVAPAQATTTLFGLVKQALVSEKVGDADATKKHANANKLGVKGSEDLGNGMAAIYKLHFQLPNGGAVTQSYDAFVGLKGGFGTILLGRFHGGTYGAVSQMDNWASSGVDPFAASLTTGGRASQLAYISPNFSGFNFSIGAATGTKAGNGAPTSGTGDSFSATTGMKLGYSNGPIKVGLGYSKFNGGNADADELTTFGLSYHPGGWGVGLATSSLEAGNAAGTKTKGAYLNAFMNFGANKVNLGYGTTSSDVSNTEDGKNFGIELVHNFSKRTKAFIGYGTSEPIYTTGGSAVKTKTTSVGLSHSF